MPITRSARRGNAMDASPRPRGAERVKSLVRDPNFWLWLGALTLATFFHYTSSNPLRGALLEASLRLTPCLAERFLFLLPVALSATRYGAAAGWLTIVCTALIMLPQAMTDSCRPESALLETAGVLIVAVFLNGSLSRQQTERRAREEASRFFVRQVLRAQEEERGRIARELHDSTVQMLSSLHQHLEILALDREILSEEMTGRIYKMERIVGDAIEEVRRFSQNLRPPALDALGLLPSLEEMAANLEREQGIAVQVHALGRVRRLEPEVELALFRIVQEALNNVHRHAQASEAIVTLWFKERTVRATIRDDGRGFSMPDHLRDLLATDRMGLVGIQERAEILGGAADIHSKSGDGTTVCVELPV